MKTTDNRTPPQILKVKYINNYWLDLYLEKQLSIQLQSNCLCLVELSSSQLVISWDLDNFNVNEVKVEDLESMEDLCKPVEQLLVFTKRISWYATWTLCQAHGGSIHTPNTEEENNQLLSTLAPHTEQCADPVSTNVAWLGIQSKDYIGYKIGIDKTLSVKKFTSWEADTAPYYL